ncbi:hypothetical protein ACOSP7_012296 [Xanthoceras sorbifolium]
MGAGESPQPVEVAAGMLPHFENPRPTLSVEAADVGAPHAKLVEDVDAQGSKVHRMLVDEIGDNAAGLYGVGGSETTPNKKKRWKRVSRKVHGACLNSSMDGPKEALSLFALFFLLFFSNSSAFESDELLVDDEEFGLEGGQPQQHQPQVRLTEPTATTTTRSSMTSRRKFLDPDSDSNIQFSLEHAFGDSDFVSTDTFSARLRTSNHGGQV